MEANSQAAGLARANLQSAISNEYILPQDAGEGGEAGWKPGAPRGVFGRSDRSNKECLLSPSSLCARPLFFAHLPRVSVLDTERYATYAQRDDTARSDKATVQYCTKRAWRNSWPKMKRTGCRGRGRVYRGGKHGEAEAYLPDERPSRQWTRGPASNGQRRTERAPSGPLLPWPVPASNLHPRPHLHRAHTRVRARAPARAPAASVPDSAPARAPEPTRPPQRYGGPALE